MSAGNMNPQYTTSQFKPLSWIDSQKAAWVLILGYLVMAIFPAILAGFLRPDTGEALFTEIGIGAALVGYGLLILQVLMGSRLPFIDRPFGHDAVTLLHKKMALVACGFLTLHPILLSLGRDDLALFALDTSWRIYLGKLALLFLLFALPFAMYFYKFHIDYQNWRLMHKGVLFIVALGFFHGLLVGKDLSELSAMRVYWFILLGIAAVAVLYRNLYVPVCGRRLFSIAAVDQETHDTWNLTLIPRQGGIPRYRPGQFMFLKLLREDLPSEEHPFTISSSPTQEGFLTATIKESGNYTRTIGQTTTRHRARVEAPFGRFSLVYHPVREFLFIGGGVGITPIMSMLRYLRDTRDPRPVLFLYGNKTEGDIIFRKELENLPSHMKVIHVLSDPATGWKGLRGFVSREIIEKHAGAMLRNAHIFLCGPPPMMKILLDVLRDLLVDEDRIHFEFFSL